MGKEIKKQIKELQKTLINIKVDGFASKKEIQLLQQKLDELYKKINKE